MRSILWLLTADRNHLGPGDRDELLALTDEAAARYARLDHVIDELAELQIQLDPTRREAARRMQVQVRLDVAGSLAPMVQMLRLEEAAGLARDHHLLDLRAEAVRRMQQLSTTDLGFQTFESEATLPGEWRDRQVRLASDGADWRQALTGWLNTPSPSGSRSANEQQVRELAQGSIVRLFRSSHLGAGQLPRWHAATEADKDAADLAWLEGIHRAVNGKILAEASTASPNDTAYRTNGNSHPSLPNTTQIPTSPVPWLVRCAAIGQATWKAPCTPRPSGSKPPPATSSSCSTSQPSP
jgi:hypothetical protein